MYSYDSGGNLTGKNEYAYTTAVPATGTPLSVKTYSYGNTVWKDLLTAYNGATLSYDGIGNLTGDGTWSYTWQHGRQLAGMSKTGTAVSYGYDADGLRVSKTVNGTTTKYYYTGSQLTDLKKGNDTLHFTYDVLGPATVTYNGTVYYYLRNAQGDITGIVNVSGSEVVSYSYDAWGDPTDVSGSMAATLGALNPFRYRGYVYDVETELYYLESRYYKPAWGRFINADSPVVPTISPDSATWDKNLFAYCDNNPVTRKDDGGQLWNVVIGFVVGGIIGGASAVINSAIKGEEVSLSTFAKGALVGAVSGAVTAALPLVGINSKGISAAVSGGLTFFGSLLTGSSVGEAAVSAAAAAASTYLSLGLASSLPATGSKFETAVAKGMVGFHTSGCTEGLFSVGRAVVRSLSHTSTAPTINNMVSSSRSRPRTTAMAY